MSIFADMNVVVMNHAVYQFALRFPEDSPTTKEDLTDRDLRSIKTLIESEVREALDHLRISPHKPSSLFPPDDPACTYAWTPAELRIYALKPNLDWTTYYVHTVMRAER